MSAAPPVPAWPHKPVPAQPPRVLPEWQMLWRGLALILLSLGSVRVAGTAARMPWWLASPVVATLATASFLSAWAAAIHLTGGQKFDDHRWV